MTSMGTPCRVMALADTPLYTYMSADVTPIYSFRHSYVNNYNNHLVKKVQREYLFIRPSTFVVMDRVESTTPTQQIWTLNLPFQPSVSPGRISMANGANSLDVYGLAPASDATGTVTSQASSRGMGTNWRVEMVRKRQRHGIPARAGHQRLGAQRHTLRRGRQARRAHRAGRRARGDRALSEERPGRPAADPRRRRPGAAERQPAFDHRPRRRSTRAMRRRRCAPRRRRTCLRCRLPHRHRRQAPRRPRRLLPRQRQRRHRRPLPHQHQRQRHPHADTGPRPPPLRRSRWTARWSCARD